MPISRREFIADLGGFALGMGAHRLQRPDLVLYRAHVITMNPAQPFAEALAIEGDRILAVGSTAEIRALARRGTRQVDVGGKTMVPGFIDAHSHPVYAGRRHLRWVDCDLRSIGAIQSALRADAAKKPAGSWVLGFKYDDTKTAERRFLTRDDLDAVSTDRPIFVEHRGGHTAYVNSLALVRADITEESPDPPGGRYQRDPTTHRLTGRLLERAMERLQEKIPDTYSPADDRAAVRLISGKLAQVGITSVHDAFGTTADLRAYQDAHEAGDLLTRIYCLIGYVDIDKMIAAGVRTGLGDEWVRVGAMKATCDGSISERTARLSQPYIGRPNDFGIFVTEEPELYQLARKAHAAGWQVGIHANGDAAIDRVLGIYERLQKELPRKDPRFRIEHCTVITPSLVQRIKQLGAIPTPFSTYVYFHGEKMREYGEDRLNRMFAHRSFLDAGIRVTEASDYPPGPFEPMMALQSMVTRTDMNGQVWGPKQRISIEEALRVATLNGAYASYEERLKGSLEEGKLADMVVLGRNPLKEDPASIITIPIERTMVGGRWVYQS
ncbi:MAG TPA: amidohydrolase [Gemmatimonadales bacterium]|nr:amidohydrolase [Gemmatimonadales bacterium]